jgi:hypothetical protein
MSSSFSGSGYSGKTQALLREGYRKAAEGKKKVLPKYADGEDGTDLVLNEVSYVERSQMAQPVVLSALISSRAAGGAAIPNLSGLPRDAGTILETIRAHQAAICRDLVQREAGREALRRALLDAETVPWRVDQLEVTFKAERSAALKEIKDLMAEFGAGYKGYESQFAEEAARNARVEAAKQRAKAIEDN